jgi:hypothetical protein
MRRLSALEPTDIAEVMRQRMVIPRERWDALPSRRG